MSKYIDKIELYKTPFDDAYHNVPDVFDYNSNVPLTFKEYLGLRFDELFDKITFEGENLKIQSFAPNDVIELTLTTLRIFEDFGAFNCCVVYYDSVPYFYFITGYKYNNSMRETSATISLVKNIWIECYDIMYNRPIYTNCLRKHLVTFHDGTFYPDYEIFHETNQLTTRKYISKDNTDVTVIWVRYIISQGYNIYDYVDGNYGEINGGPHRSYGNMRYLFFPLVAYNGFGSRFDNITLSDMYGNSVTSTNYKVPQPETTKVLKMDLTSYIPVSLSYEIDVTENSLSIQCVGTAEKVGNIFTKFASTSATDDFESFGRAGTNSPLLYFENRGGVVEYLYTYTFDNTSGIDRVYNPYDDVSHLPEFYNYPYRYYSIVLPDGKTVPLAFESPVRYISIKIRPTDNGGTYQFQVFLWNRNTPIINYEQTTTTFNSIGEIPISQSGLLAYMETKGYEYATNLKERKYDLVHQGVVNTVNSTISAAQSASSFAMSTNPKTSMNAIFNFTKNSIEAVDTITNTATKYEFLNLNHEAFIKDLQNQVTVSGGGGGDYQDVYIQDRVLVFKDECVYNNSLACEANEIITKGALTKVLTNPLSNVRKYYDFNQCKEYNNLYIGNNQYREIMNIIFTKGVRKWHMDNFSRFDLYIDNEVII